MTDVPPSSNHRLTRSAVTIAAGLTVTGLGTVVLMAAAARSLTPSEYASFAVWWTVATLLGTGFGVFEANLARLVVTEVATGGDSRGVTGLMAGRSLLVAGTVSVTLVVLAPWLSSRLFGGSLATALLLPLFLLLAAAQAHQRGAATGHRRFAAMAGQLSTDGAARALFGVVLIAADLDTPGSLALACCAAAGAGLVVGSVMCPEWMAIPRLHGEAARWRPLAILLSASLGPLLVNNGSVPWLAGTSTVGAYTLGAFAGAVTLSRLPSQFVSAAFSPLLAALSHCVEAGDESTFRRLLRRAEILALGAGLLFVAGFTLAGPWLLTLYLGPRYNLPRGVLSALAAASAVMFVSIVQQAGLVAKDRWGVISTAWMVATGVFAVVLLLPIEPVARATAAPVVAVCAAFAFMVNRRRSPSASGR